MTCHCENLDHKEKIQILLGSGRTKQLTHAESSVGAALQTRPATAKAQTQRGNASKILQENNFHPVNTSHAKILTERKRNVQIAMTSKKPISRVPESQEGTARYVPPTQRCEPRPRRETQKRGGPEQHEGSRV